MYNSVTAEYYESMTRATSPENVGRGVRVTLRNGTVTDGVVVGAPEDGTLIYREFVETDRGARTVEVETKRAAADQLEAVELHVFVCTVCHREVNVVHRDGICTDCVRRLAAQRDKGERSRCEDCSGPSAFRNPRYDAYRCVRCHTAAGTLPSEELDDGSTAECAGKPVSDPRHSWKFVRGARRACRNCYTHDYLGVRP